MSTKPSNETLPPPSILPSVEPLFLAETVMPPPAVMSVSSPTATVTVCGLVAVPMLV